MKLNLFFPIILLAFGILTSCGVDDSENPDAESTFGIRHDRELSDYEEKAAETGSDLPDFSSVICFQYNLTGGTELDYVASGTVIDEYWILTAGHNFFTSDEQTSPAPASGIIIAIGNDPNDPDAQYEVEELVFHPTWLTDDDGYANGNDLCLVKTKEPITGITPQALYAGSDEPIGSKVWYCGFGDYSQIEGQNPDLYSKKHAHENILDRVVGGIETSIDGTT
ncbi:MAG: trypsin-like serine protease, partial [Bacteroidetes bacterium]|nr:trypsin-like serine protease [Bacteroidota bacterium]